MYQIRKVQPKIFALYVHIFAYDTVQAVRFVLLGQCGRAAGAHGIREIRHIICLAFVKLYLVQAFFEREIAHRKTVFRIYLVQNAFLIFFVQHHKVGRQRQQVSVFFEYFVAGAVKGEYPAAVLVGHMAANASAHFPRRFIGESHGKYMLGRYAQRFGDVNVSAREHARFAASRTRGYAHKALRCGNGSQLFFI